MSRSSLTFLVLSGFVMYAESNPPVPAPSTTAKDPGVRSGASGAGGPLLSLTPQQLALFNSGSASFNEIDSVSGTMSGESSSGLGPTFNLNSCGGCQFSG